MRRRPWIIGVSALGAATLAGIACRVNSQVPPSEASAAVPPGSVANDSHAFKLSIDPTDSGPPVNRLLLGENVQWVDGGDGQLDRDGKPRPEMLAKVRALAPTALRFPGGAQTDVYHWERAMGPLNARGPNRHFHNGQMQPSLMGTAEFLELCETLDAAPLISVNVASGTPEEAASWLRRVNVDGVASRIKGRMLPRVPYWELGNEPYLKEGDKTLWMKPDVYAARCNDFIRALRSVDPTIRIGLPLRNDRIGGATATHYPAFAQTLLAGVREPVDFLCVHNAYMPSSFDKVPGDGELYWAVVGAAATVADDLDAMQALQTRIRPDRPPLPVAITEYAPLFTLGHGATDSFAASPLGALYVADLLRTLAQRDDILLAQHWSLSGNWLFGSIAQDGHERPVFHALQLMSQTLHGQRLDCSVDCLTFDSSRAGAAAPLPHQPLITALATRDGRMFRILLMNKHPVRRAVGSLEIDAVASVVVERLLCSPPLRVSDDPNAVRRTSERQQPNVNGTPLTLSLPPASLALYHITLKN